MSKQKAAAPVAPRNLASLQAATKLLEVICLTPPKGRNIAGAVDAVVLHYAERELELPVTERTLRFYAETGIALAGHPELAQPFLEVAACTGHRFPD